MALHKDVRRQRAFEEFKRRLDGMSPAQIRAMLEQRRIRSPERIELAEVRLKQHEKAASGAAGAKAETAAQRRRPGGNGHDRRREPEAQEALAAGGTAADAGTAVGGEEVPMARQVGRMLGIGLGIASIAALAVLAIRR